MGQLSLQGHLNQAYFKDPQLIQTFSQLPTINFNQVKHQCILIGQGCSAKIYLYKKLNLVFKIIKGKPNPQQVIKQIIILNKLNSIWPNLFKYLVINSENSLIGFSMIYFQGKRLWQAYRDPQNIYFRNPESRVRLVKKLKQVVRRVQQLGIGHGDLHVDNIMIKQPDRKSEECELLIIDYGLAFQIDEYAPQNPPLTGWAFMKPWQSKTGYFYDASGLNAYMFGRVALQILLLESYEDYSHFRQESPQRQLNLVKQLGFDQSVIEQIECYLDKDIKVRTKMLMSPSIMKETLVRQYKGDKINEKAQSYGWSLLNFIRKNMSDDNYYVRHPQKLGYKNNQPK